MAQKEGKGGDVCDGGPSTSPERRLLAQREDEEGEVYDA
jgi:hypothetical protein